ncbi:MAG: hypothetical protein K2W96_10085 [Gemmataceae bacterium]|nr:hypothetical protein [Gemmataceae bacterium]
MTFSDFTLRSAVESFGLTESTEADLFAGTLPVEPGPLLRTFLDDYAPTAVSVGSEAARSRYIIAPFLLGGAAARHRPGAGDAGRHPRPRSPSTASNTTSAIPPSCSASSSASPTAGLDARRAAPYRLTIGPRREATPCRAPSSSPGPTAR